MEKIVKKKFVNKIEKKILDFKNQHESLDTKFTSSQYKNILRPNRCNFLFANLQQITIIIL